LHILSLINNAEFRQQYVVQVETDGKAEGSCRYVKNKLGNVCSADTSGDLAVLLTAECKFMNNFKESSENRSILNVFSALNTFNTIFLLIFAKNHDLYRINFEIY
jgi:hypothetical protein